LGDRKDDEILTPRRRRWLINGGCGMFPLVILWVIIHNTLDFIFEFPIFLVLIGILIFFVVYDKKYSSEESEENIDSNEILLFEIS